MSMHVSGQQKSPSVLNVVSKSPSNLIGAELNAAEGLHRPLP